MRSAAVSDRVLVLLSEIGERLVIRSSPFRVGREPDSDLTLHLPDVSGSHAEFLCESNAWTISDCGSTNGTFVNGARITGATPLAEGDLIHLGQNTFRVTTASTMHRRVANTALLASPEASVQSALDLIRVLGDRLVYPFYQPLIDLGTHRPIGWEALGRAKTESGVGPAPLLAVAETHRKARVLSDSFTMVSAECAQCRYCWPPSKEEYLFLNIHPRQLEGARPFELPGAANKSKLKKWYRLVVELPESLVCNTEQMAGWVDEIRRQGMLVAYDDFGQGQSRITDLLKVPPDFLKLDRELIVGLENERPKQTLVKAVVEACKTLGVRTVGEGIETEQELQACTDAGIEIGQGYLLSPPQPAYDLFGTARGSLPDTCPMVRLKVV